MRETKLSDNALTVLKKRYFWKDEKANFTEDWAGVCKRVSDFLFPDNEEMRDKTNDLLFRRVFLPNTPTLANAGRKDGQLSACFVLPIEDSMDGIFTTLHDTALIHKTGGGTGFSFSRLRPKDSLVRSTNGKASGVVSFLNVFDAATESVKQGGIRRGANMGILRVDHPEIMDWIMCKDDTSKLHNFNLSIGVTDDFMQALEEKDDSFHLIDPSTGEITETVHARDIWKQLVHQSWKNGEPGIIFLDTMNRANPTPEYGDFESTNPCGEQPLLPYESCNLGSIDLAKCVIKMPDGHYTIDETELDRTVVMAVHILNAVIDHNSFPLEKIRENTLRTRKIGLGVMGWADLLLLLGIPYDSEQAITLAEDIMGFIEEAAHLASVDYEYQNATCTTIAPTGSIGMIADTSGGIEPNFSWVYTRNSMDTKLYVVHPILEEILKERGIYRKDILEKLERGTPIRLIPELRDLGNVWKTSQEIAPAWHVRMQAAFQKYTDNAVSKTINLPPECSEEEISDIFWLAYELGCKGTTVYRDGSRENQVLNHKQDEPKEEMPAEAPMLKMEKRERPDTVFGFTQRFRIGCGKIFVTVNHDADGNILEAFAATGKNGGCKSNAEGLSWTVSLALRYGVPVEELVKQLRSVKCMNCMKDGLDAKSCPDALGRALENALKMRNADTSVTLKNITYIPKEKSTYTPKEDIETDNRCPVCGAKLLYTEGCVKCSDPGCDWSRCGG